ncbi:hypothetical protein ACFL20_04490 [Spirochaetota bacterium]
MDATVKQMLDSFTFSIKNYTSSLGPDNPKIVEAKGILDKLVEMAEGGADITKISMDPGFATIGGLIGELASETPLSSEELKEYGYEIQDDAVPPASIPAAGYHMAYDAMPPDVKEKNKPYYDRIFEIEKNSENAIFFNTSLLEDGVLLEMSREPLMESAKETIEKSKEAYSPTVEYQQKLTIETYEKVNTVPELEFEGTRLAELSNVEHEWDALFLDVIGLLPACAQAIEAFGPSDDLIQKLKNSYKFMAEFMGIDWDDVFANERYLYFWNNVFFPRIPDEKRTKYNVKTPEGYRDVLKNQFFDPFIKDEPVPVKNKNQNVLFWGKEIDVKDVMSALRNPPRPEV